MTKKIAFLFMTLSNPNFPDIWNKYFEKANPEQYSIYIHPKYPMDVTWHRECIIPNLKETAWGKITEAYISLLGEAYKNPDNIKFVTISESCVPIQSFQEFYKNATSDPRSWIKSMPISNYNKKARIDGFIETLNKKNKNKNILIPTHFIKHYSRFMLNRENAGELLSKKKELEFMYKMPIADEFILSIISPLKIKNVRDFSVTTDDWDYVDKLKLEIKNRIRLLYEEQEKAEQNGNKVNKTVNIQELKTMFNNIAKNPKTITNVTQNNDLQKIKSCQSFFYRKFAKTSNISKYWDEIIEYHTQRAANKQTNTNILNNNLNKNKTAKKIVKKTKKTKKIKKTKLNMNK